MILLRSVRSELWASDWVCGSFTCVVLSSLSQMTLLASKQLDRQFVGSCRYTSSISFTLDPTESPFAIPILWSMVKHSEYELTEVYSDSTTNLLNDFFRQVCVGEIRIATSGRRFHGATGVGSITPGLIHLCRRDLCLALEQN